MNYALQSAIKVIPDHMPIVLGNCPECGYSRTGIADDVACPECAWRAEPGEVVLWGTWYRADAEEEFKRATGRNAQSFLEPFEPAAAIAFGSAIVAALVLERFLPPGSHSIIRHSVNLLIVALGIYMAIGMRHFLAFLKGDDYQLSTTIQLRFLANRWSLRLGPGKPRWKRQRISRASWAVNESEWNLSLRHKPRWGRLALYDWRRVFTFHTERDQHALVAMQRVQRFAGIRKHRESHQY